MSEPGISRATQQDLDEVIDEFSDATIEILRSKGEEYATDEDRLMNFRTVGDMAGLEPEQVTVTYLLKHIQRLAKAVEEDDYVWDWRHEDGGEALKQRVADSINYLYLLALALEAENQEPDGDGDSDE